VARKRLISANRRSISAIGIKALTCLFKPLDRNREAPNRHKTETEEGTKMKKFGFATIIASGLAAAVVGFAGPAQADVIHHDWVHDIQQEVTVPQVDTTVQQRCPSSGFGATRPCLLIVRW
jgi:hypothetical protein